MASENGAGAIVILATYNEAENVVLLVDAILAHLPAAHVLVVDDNSPDGTGRLADEYAARESRVHAVHRAGKLGLGTATLTGLRYALDQDFEFAIVMDADFSHPPPVLPKLVAGMAEYDVMIGSRYVPGGGIVGWGFKRKFMSRAINIYSRLVLGLKARDCSGAFRCYRTAKLKEIDFGRVYSKGYSFQEEFLFRCQRAGCRIGETPITFVDRRFGSSKINLKEGLVALWALLVASVRR